MKSKFLFYFIFLSCSFPVFSQGLKIEVIAPQLPNHPLKLVNYFNGGNYTQDTLRLSEEGIGKFELEEKLPEGLYLVYLDSIRFFDVLLGEDQTFQINIDTTSFLNKNTITGSEDSEAFLEYARFISNKQKERNQFINEFQALKAENKNTEEISTLLDTLNNQVSDFQNIFFEKHKDKWVAKFFKGLEPITTGPFPQPKNMDEAREEFQYQKYHFFDNIDLSDSRYWYTNYFSQKIDHYITRQVEFIPDSIAKMASWLVAQTNNDSISFRIMLSKLTNFAIKSDYMGMENVWAKLAEDYYFKDISYKPDSTFLANLNSEYRKIKYNRLGMTAFNLTLEDSTGQQKKLYDLTDKYTLIYFYEPSCGHCKKTTPKLHDELYNKYKDKGFSVVCICTIDDKNEWLKFVNDHNLKDWNNLWDPQRESYFWQFYDTSTTPSLYVIDEDKRIIAKKLDLESLDRLLLNMLGTVENQQNGE